MPRFVTFTPNPALDLATSIDRVVPSHKLRCAAPLVHPGGGGINVARVLHRLGADVLAVYPAGGSTGERLHGLIQEEGVPGLRIPIAGETRESFTVHERGREGGAGSEFRFVLPGPTLSASEWTDGLDCLRQLSPKPAWVIASGSLPPGVHEDGYAQVARVAQEMGARMVLDSSGPALAAALEQGPGVWLVKPSLRELSELAGRSLEGAEEQVQAARKLIKSARAQMVAVSLGEGGALLVTQGHALRGIGPQVQVAGTVGAGDSFLAGLVWALDLHRSLDEALATALAAGSAAVAQAGTAMARGDLVRALIAQMQVQEVSA